MTWRSYAGEQGKGLPIAKPSLILHVHKVDIQGSVAFKAVSKADFFVQPTQTKDLLKHFLLLPSTISYIYPYIDFSEGPIY